MTSEFSINSASGDEFFRAARASSFCSSVSVSVARHLQMHATPSMTSHRTSHQRNIASKHGVTPSHTFVPAPTREVAAPRESRLFDEVAGRADQMNDSIHDVCGGLLNSPSKDSAAYGNFAMLPFLERRRCNR